MKFAKLNCITAIALFTLLAIPVQLAAQDKQDHHHMHHHYQLIDLGTFGGPNSYVNVTTTYAPVLNNGGDVTGWAETSASDPYAPNFCFNVDCLTSHAFHWHDGETTDLGILPNGANSASSWISSNGLVAGVSENGQIDPLLTGQPEFRAVLWHEGGIADLGTLEGGYESWANAVNDQGVVVGWATNTVPDPFPFADGGASQGLGYQTRAFLSRNGTIEDLGTLGTGTDATAYLVNGRGQVAGASFIDQALNTTILCGQNAPTQDPFFWDRDKGMIDVGTLGGVCGFASGLNKRGQVVGLSDLLGDQQWHAFAWDQQRKIQDLGTLGGSNSAAIMNNDAGHAIGTSLLSGDIFSERGFLWRNGKMANLGSLHDDLCSEAYSLNSKDQVVGSSIPGCDFNNESGYSVFLWEDGAGIVDLNTLVSRGSDLHLSVPETINDRGQIAGFGFLPNGEQHAFLLIPCDEKNLGIEDCDYGLVDAATATRELPAPVMHEPTTTVPRTLRPFGRRGSSLRQFGTQTGRLPIAENGGLPLSAPSAGLTDGTSPPCSTRCGPWLRLLPTSLTFPAQQVGTKSAPQTVTLSNAGNLPGSVPSISIVGSFLQTNNCPGTLRAHATCQIHVRFLPQAKGTAHGTLSVGSLHAALSGLGE